LLAPQKKWKRRRIKWKSRAALSNNPADGAIYPAAIQNNPRLFYFILRRKQFILRPLEKNSGPWSFLRGFCVFLLKYSKNYSIILFYPVQEEK
jgi:hypothetical protein